MEALIRSRWKIHGSGGAAGILDINPSTLASRMKKLNIKKPSKSSLNDYIVNGSIHHVKN
jgi:hypothetical protein